MFIPKCRRKALYWELRRYLGDVFHELARQKECRVEEGHLMPDHVHMLLSIPPKHSVAQVLGFFKGKNAIHVARAFGGRKRNFVGQHFWARGYLVPTVGKVPDFAQRSGSAADGERSEPTVPWNRLLAVMFFAIPPRSISGTALDNLFNRRADVAT